jgi:hypothetical protein
MQTFVVDNVKPDSRKNLSTASAEAVWSGSLVRMNSKSWREEPTGAQLLGCSPGTLLQAPPRNPLTHAVGMAYNYHYPLSLSPDAVWTTIAQGFAAWINENSEMVRKQFVDFEGKVFIEIEVPPSPDWNRTLAEFSEKIGGYVGKKKDLLVSSFSTTTPDAKAASEVVLMYAMSKYFDYGMRTMCGFPRITLEGSVEDWENIRDRVRTFGDFSAASTDKAKTHMTEWLDALLPTLDAFVDTAKGKIDLSFWRSFYHEDGGSGGPYVSGRVLSLFPYVNQGGKLSPNKYMAGNTKTFGGLTPSDFDRGLSTVNVRWNRLGDMRAVEFRGGLAGVSVAEDSTLRPECGWAVIDVTDAKNKR